MYCWGEWGINILEGISLLKDSLGSCIYNLSLICPLQWKLTNRAVFEKAMDFLKNESDDLFKWDVNHEADNSVVICVEYLFPSAPISKVCHLAQYTDSLQQEYSFVSVKLFYYRGSVTDSVEVRGCLSLLLPVSHEHRMVLTVLPQGWINTMVGILVCASAMHFPFICVKHLSQEPYLHTGATSWSSSHAGVWSICERFFYLTFVM